MLCVIQVFGGIAIKSVVQVSVSVSTSPFLMGALEAEVRLEVLGDLMHKTLEGELVEEELSGLLVLTDPTESKSKSETCDLHTANNKEAASMQQL